ncbi:MBL fold metallo-hydrolase [Listeria grandensis]|uniref:MBL fold metallo-hydrolase n=1 Tax=Listeria grandensis TaxID=1494963 RepID=A0A7X1CP34_9LIST|nr:MBL fold metallo-hydrolase [Listeria grandensis]MBC1473547.1 MBL fold metallo-hydrolase [Listeria grandensis]MBC1935573.1 MBL fold metallo-hydrolase [Listeria grandensis]
MKRLTGWGIIAIFLIALISGCSNNTQSSVTENTLKGAKFTFFDVGQGDSTLIQADDGTTILIDTGRHDDNRIMTYLEKADIQKIDLLLLTHPHSDHIGNADKVINQYKPKEIWMDGLVFNSSIYERVIDAALASNAKYKEPRRGEKATFGPFGIQVLSPDKLSDNANNDSIAIRLTYKDVAAIFTGDAEKPREREMVDSGLDLNAQILDLGHHGSSTSNQPYFLDAVKPEVAVYSAEKGNSYGHPHREVIQWLKDRDITTYGTDVEGTVTIETDGKQIHVATEKSGTPKPGNETGKQTAEEPGNAVPVPDKINVNTATAEELQYLPSVGPVLADKIIAERPYRTIDDLKKINGIGDGIVRQIKEQGIATVK